MTCSDRSMLVFSEVSFLEKADTNSFPCVEDVFGLTGTLTKYLNSRVLTTASAPTNSSTTYPLTRIFFETIVFQWNLLSNILSFYKTYVAVLPSIRMVSASQNPFNTWRLRLRCRGVVVRGKMTLTASPFLHYTAVDISKNQWIGITSQQSSAKFQYLNTLHSWNVAIVTGYDFTTAC